MRTGIRFLSTLSLAALSLVAQPAAAAQSDGSLQGRVTLKASGDPLHGASVTLVELGRIAISQDDGSYRFQQLPPGRYTVEAHLDSLFTEASTTVTIEAGQTVEADFGLVLAPRQYEITVTGSEKRETTFESFQSVESIGPHELSQSTDVSLGEMLDHRVGTGIAKRGFGPGPARPIVRGFDGDRVLIMEDGIRTGTLSSQSGDHGEMINPAQLERLEVVKGPATLLYSGNAMGGTVNAISRHHEAHRHAHQGFRGFVSGSGGTTNALGGGSAGLEYGTGNWMIWGRGGGIRTGDYRAPEQGKIYNSRSQLRNGGGGLGWYGNKFFFSVEAKFDDGAYGVPFVQEFHGHHGEGGHGGEDHGEEGDEDEEGDHHDEEGDEDEEEDHHDEEGDEDEEEDHHDEEGDEDEEGEDHDEEGEDHDEEGEDHDEDGEDHDEDGHGEEEIDRILLDSRRRNFRFTGGSRDLGMAIDEFVLKLSLTDWNHKEIEFLEDGEQNVGTVFDQQEFVYRGVFEQKKVGPLSGRFGFWGLDREYSAVGEEALSPPVDQTGFALYALEELDFETARFQFGGRLETQRYRPGFAARGGGHGEEENGEGEHEDEAEEGEEVPEAVRRTFTGASASAGLQADTWSGGSLVVNYSHSFRAPSLEELYNYGPHAGTLSFEIGDPALRPETGDGIETSLRHNSRQLRGELSLFYYNFDNFVFPFAPGQVEDGLPVIEFTQLNARFLGTEANLGINLNPMLWLNLGMDYVDAQETERNTPLPRIPPLRGKLGLDFDHLGFRVSPELILAAQQHQTFTGETRTPGYAVMNLKASYTFAQQHLAHQFSVRVFNLSDRLYRNHSSFIKDLAPEIGRGVRLTYTMRFF